MSYTFYFNTLKERKKKKNENVFVTRISNLCGIFNVLYVGLLRLGFSGRLPVLARCLSEGCSGDAKKFPRITLHNKSCFIPLIRP